MTFRRALIAAAVCACATSAAAGTILAVGAHAGDMELTCGALLLKETLRGDRVVILHLTLGERGNPALTADAYGAQKRREAAAAAAGLGAEVIFGPYRDGEIPDTDDARNYVAGIIKQVKPALVITHWRKSIHKDHARTGAIVADAVLLASFDGWRGVRSVWFAENWEDAEGFAPYLYVDVSGMIPRWRDAVTKYEFVRGGISSFAYLEYYTALATLRGAEARKKEAVAFDVEPSSKRRVLDDVP